MDGIGWGPVAVVAVGIVVLVAAGARLTEIGPWYRALRKPSWQPPEWLFGPVWTAIFLMLGASAVLAWTGAAPGQGAAVVAVYAVNAVLNVAWSGLFFRLRRPDWALMEIALLWLSILAIVAVVAPIDMTAAWLVLPYLAWVGFAAVLNATIVRLNPRAAA